MIDMNKNVVVVWCSLIITIAFLIYMVIAMFNMVRSTGNLECQIESTKQNVQHILQIEEENRQVNEENKKINEQILDVLKDHSGDVTQRLRDRRLEREQIQQLAMLVALRK